VTLDEHGIVITDDGAGPNGVPGTGLLGLAERAEAAGAVLSTRVRRPHGFELAVRTRPQPSSPVPDAVSLERTER
jgi:two-component system sensor histidine kinase DesK